MGETNSWCFHLHHLPLNLVSFDTYILPWNCHHSQYNEYIISKSFFVLLSNDSCTSLFPCPMPHKHHGSTPYIVFFVCFFLILSIILRFHSYFVSQSVLFRVIFCWGGYTTIYKFFHLLMDIWVISILGLLQI